MSDANHSPTAEQDRISIFDKLVYGFGAFVNNLLAAAIGGMTIVLNLGLGMNPALVGMLAALPRLTDAITDPLMGYISDHTRSRWGRRRPYIFCGAILAGLIFILLWQLPEGKTENYYFWYFLIGSFIFYLAYTMFATPWVALGYELTPDYHERTRLMGVQNFMGQIAYLISPWFLWVMQREEWFEDLRAGASGLAILIGVAVVVVGVLPAIFLRERHTADAEAADGETKNTVAENTAPTLLESIMDFFQGFVITLKFTPFLKLCAATFLVFNGFMLVASFQFYVIIYYVFGGNQDLGAEYGGWAGTVSAISTFVVIVITTFMSSRIGKRKAFYITTGLSILGYCLKWFCYNPDHPWMIMIPAPLIAFGLGGLFTLMPAMVADVCDMDELETHERREGMFGSIFWWVVKLGMAAALAASGFLLNATGFDVALEGAQSADTIFWMRIFDALIPAMASAVAIWMVASYPITEDKAAEIRQQLEARRGSL